MGIRSRSKEELSVHNTVDGFLSVEEWAQDQLQRCASHVTFLKQAVHKVFVVELDIHSIATVNCTRLQFWQKLKASAIIGIDVSVEDLSIEGVVGDQQMDAVDVISTLGCGKLLSVVLSIELFKSIIELGAHIHHFNGHADLFLVVVCISTNLPLAMSS